MNSSSTKYMSISSPHTCNLSEKHFPQSVLMQPIFHPASWKRLSGNEEGFASSLPDSQKPDAESLAEEKRYQLELQQWIHENEELVGLFSDELEDDSLEEDSLDEMSLKELERAEYDTNQHKNGVQKNDDNRRKQQSVDKYSSLRYNPNWKNIKEAIEFSEAEKACQVAEGSSMDFSEDSFYLHSNGSPEEKNQEEAKSQDLFSEFGTELQRFHEPNILVVSSESFRLPTKEKESADGCPSKDTPNTYSSAVPPQTQDRPKRAKKDFVKKNKRTLGLHSKEINSYLQLHCKKQEVLGERVTDPQTVDEEPVQSVLPFQTRKMQPEDKWFLKAQQLKDHQNKSSKKNKKESNQSLKGRAFPRSDSQQALTRAEPKLWHQRHHQVSRSAPLQVVEQDNSSTLQKWRYPSSSVGPDTKTAANLGTSLSNFLNSRHFVKQDFTAPTYPSVLNTLQPRTPSHPPAVVISPAYTRKKIEKYHQHDSPNRIPHGQQHLYTVQLLARNKSTNGRAHPNQRNSSSTFNTNFQQLVKDQVSLQGCKSHICVDQNCAVNSLSSPRARRTTSQFTEMMERHHQETASLTEAHLADRYLFSLLPPVIPRLEGGSEVDTESSEGNQVKINPSNSGGYLMQMTDQPIVSKKPYSSKAYINVNMTLGGLGPDYEALKEKKEKLRQQKEYAKQIREHNMKSTALVQWLPIRPQVISSVSRQKALEYAKKIPRPKTFMARLSDEDAKQEGVLPQTLNGCSLPQVAALETLQSRHEREKQIAAALRALHIL
ncbi:jhy protein homolog [Podargus strigoides]